MAVTFLFGVVWAATPAIERNEEFRSRGRRLSVTEAARLGAVVASGPVRILHTIQFGEDFELDFQSYKLRRAGRVLKLERIPMEILLFLIEQNGQLVTRDQIVEKIWGKDVFLDTDNSINGAIRKVRQVLK